MERLLLRNLWSEIGRLSQRARRVEAAIAYVTSESHLKMGKGDLLVVNASEAAIRSGETSARVLRKLHRRGVSLFSAPSLHAKMVLVDQRVMIGSANASLSSASALDEAAILTDTPVVVSQARSFVRQLARDSEPLNTPQLKRLLAIKVVRRRGQRALSKKRPRRIKAAGTNTWIVSTVDLEDGEYADEQPAVDQALDRIKRTQPKADPTWIRWTGQSGFRKNARNGDMLIVMTAKRSGRKPYCIDPPTTLLWRQDRANWVRFYHNPDLARPLRSVKWPEFQQLCREAGIRRRVTANTVRALSATEAAELHRLWPRSRGRR